MFKTKLIFFILFKLRRTTKQSIPKKKFIFFFFEMECELLSGTLSKFSLGRSVGLSAGNWKQRHLKLTSHRFLYSKTANSAPSPAGASPRNDDATGGAGSSSSSEDVLFECPLSAVSMLFTAPTAEDHAEVKRVPADERRLLFALRLFENGVFTVLLKAEDATEKDIWVAALTDALRKKSKSVQIV